MKIDRRTFLQTVGAAGAALAIPHNGLANGFPSPVVAPPEPLDFVFFTDTHIQPELDAGHGCEMAFAKIAELKPEFAIMGGDHVFDAYSVDKTRADLVYALYTRTQKALGMPVHHAIGNHDIFDAAGPAGAAASDTVDAKKMFEDRIGKPTYYSFDQKGYHFVVLDSIQPRPERLWEARVDDAQLDWLRNDLTNVTKGAPVIVVIHCPMVTAFASYAQIITAGRKYNTMTVANSPQVLEVLAGANVIGVLQGHTHINERVDYLGTPYITSGAVCGNWWRGARMGTPEGYSVISVRDGKLTARYETYGFKSVVPNPT
jgi:3',5'-cyclic-AMP phosphodiesterase